MVGRITYPDRETQSAFGIDTSRQIQVLSFTLKLRNVQITNWDTVFIEVITTEERIIRADVEPVCERR